MGKKIFFAASVFGLFFVMFSCVKKAPANPVFPPVPTATMSLSIRVNVGMPSLTPGTMNVLVYVSDNNKPCPEATVVIDGIAVPFNGHYAGYTIFLDFGFPSSYGQVHAVTVTARGVNFTDISFPVPGDITASGDGLSVSWVYSGNLYQFQLIKPSGAFMGFPDVLLPVSPQLYDASIYPDAGAYTLNAWVFNRKETQFNNTAECDGQSYITTGDFKSTVIVK